MKIKSKNKNLYIIIAVVAVGVAAFILWKKGLFAKWFKKKQA